MLQIKDDTDAETRAKLDKALTIIAEELSPLVEAIEKRPMTTRNHYGDYMGLLGQMANGEKHMLKLTAMALLTKTNANKQGVRDAYKICAGEI